MQDLEKDGEKTREHDGNTNIKIANYKVRFSITITALTNRQ